MPNSLELGRSERPVPVIDSEGEDPPGTTGPVDTTGSAGGEASSSSGETTAGVDGDAGCGCRGTGPGGWLGVPPLLLALRRRRR